MSNIIEHGSNEPEVMHYNSTEGSEISLKTYQDIYHQITGKTEEIRKTYKDSICLEYSDIQQLHTKITQLLDVYNVVALNESITIYYEKERKEQFSSFEKFGAFNASGTSPVSNVVIKYNISIIPANLKRPQEYSLTIRLSSRVSQLREIREDAPSFMPPQIIATLISETVEIRVEYADYVIARGFIESFDEWMKGCNKTPENPYIKWSQKYSHFIPPLGKIIILLLYGFYIYSAIDPILGKEATLIVFAKYLVLSAIIFSLAINIGNVAFKLIERTIDTYSEISWIKLNKGDEVAINECSTSQLKNISLLIASTLGAIAIGVISSQISGLIDTMT